MSRFIDDLLLKPLRDGSTWVVMVPFGYDVGGAAGDTVKVDVGFMTDFASVPRPLWSLIPKWGKYGYATVIHDWLYWTQPMPRKQADDILLQGMKDLRVRFWHKYPIYAAVRLFGGVAWRRNQWDRAAGFDRVRPDCGLMAGQEAGRPGLCRRAWRHMTSRTTPAPRQSQATAGRGQR